MAELVVASDIHLSKSFDNINDIIPAKYGVINPTQNLEDLVKKIKSDQILILNGDLVAYYYSNYESGKEDNWDLLFEILKKCRGKWYLNLGNHDYRLMPYNYLIYSLEDINVDKELFRKYKKEIGFTKFRGLNELKSIIVNLKRFNTLQKYPFDRYYSVELDDMDLIFLDTGCDAFVKPSNYLKALNINLVLMLARLANSDGLGDDQIEFLKGELKKGKDRRVVIFVHAPPFFKVRELKTSIKVEIDNFNSKIWKEGLYEGIFINNNAEFMELILGCDRNVMVISGHNHLCKQYVVNKRTRMLRETTTEEINKLRKEGDWVKFVGLPGLGVIDKRVASKNKLGYLVINERQINYKILKVYD